MIHAITFRDPATGTSWNTRDDWGLALQTQPVFPEPQVKTNYLDVVGGNGKIDLSTAITGYPVYDDRTGSLTFVEPAAVNRWQGLIHQLAALLHGQYMHIILDDDPGWYYEGRVALEVGECSRQHATVVVSYEVGPFQWAERATNEPWLWDPFSFIDGVIWWGYYEHPDYYVRDDAVTTTAEALTLAVHDTGHARLRPAFAVTADETTPAGSVTVTWTTDDDTGSATIAAGQSGSISGLSAKAGKWFMGDDECSVTAVTDTGKATLRTSFTAIFQGADAFGHIAVGTTAAALTFTAQETGDAPQQPSFLATGADVTLTVTAGETTVTKTLTAGTPARVPGLVMYRGVWLYNGRTAAVSAATASGTATLGLTFRPGRI